MFMLTALKLTIPIKIMQDPAADWSRTNKSKSMVTLGAWSFLNAQGRLVAVPPAAPEMQISELGWQNRRLRRWDLPKGLGELHGATTSTRKCVPCITMYYLYSSLEMIQNKQLSSETVVLSYMMSSCFSESPVKWYLDEPWDQRFLVRDWVINHNKSQLESARIV
jgi:hypothetical protein